MVEVKRGRSSSKNYCFDTMSVFKGSLNLTAFNVAVATLLKPLVSRKTRPAGNGIDQYLTPPFPLPIRTSWGFFVTGNWGAKQIHVLEIFLRERRNTFLADSICSLK
jgi:hypothetical protein